MQYVIFSEYYSVFFLLETTVVMHLKLIMESYSGTADLIIRCAAHASIIPMEAGGTFFHLE